jgi:hypothetical protein
MNWLKFIMQWIEIFDILAYADNEAVIYLKKQGFNNKEIKVDFEYTILLGYFNWLFSKHISFSQFIFTSVSHYQKN